MPDENTTSRIDDDGADIPLLRVPPPTAFWSKYNRQSEFALGFMFSTFIHVLFGAAQVVGVYYVIYANSQSEPLPVKTISLDGGPDEAGLGAAGSGGQPEPVAEGSSNPLKTPQDALPAVRPLPEIREEITKAIQVENPESNLPIAPANAKALAALDQVFRDKALGLGARKGATDNPGTGDTGQPGAGNGGSGPNTPRARSLRWVIKFRTASGRDYLDQLAAMGAVVIVPVPRADHWLVFDNPKVATGRRGGAEDDAKFAQQIRFGDERPSSVEAVAEALKLDFTPRSFWAVFPKGLEEELADKERRYRGRRSEDIEETVFQVTIRGGSYEIVVYDQKAMR